MSEVKIKEWAIPHVKKFRTYIDIGGDIGSTSIPFINLFEEIHVFEPHPVQYAELSKNKNIKSYNVALSDNPGLIKLIIPNNNPEHGSIALRRNKNWVGESFEVETKTLDSFQFHNVDFIKIDVEQGELEVINGALNTIKTHLPVIMFENKRKENDIIIDILKKVNYNILKYKSDTIAYI